MVFERFTRTFTKLSFNIFEPLTPVFFTYFLNRKLDEWKDEETIQDYKARVNRIRKYHYKVDLDLFLTPRQARDGLVDSVISLSKRIRR